MRAHRSFLLGVGPVVLLLLFGFVFGSSATLADTSSTASAVESNVTSFMTQQLATYRGAEGPFQNGVWTDATDTCWACDNGGPATAAATLYVLTGASDTALLNESEETIDTAITDDQNADGSFNPPTESPDVDNSIWFGDELGTTFRLLQPYLGAETLARWRAALSADANYLINSGDTTWYINGNINLAETELLWLTWQATGNPAFETDYTNSWAFIITPPETEFPGAGWFTVQSPTQANGSDGQGYFAETGAGGTGWDPYYATLQLDVAARLYLLSGDPRALCAANMIMNSESPLINTSNWTINTSNGTRHTGTGGVGLITSAYAVLGFEGGRTDLVANILPQIEQEEQSYREPGQADEAGMRRAFGNSVAVVALAAALADPATSPTVGQCGLLGVNSPTSTSSSTTAPTTSTTPSSPITVTATTPTTTSPTPTTIPSLPTPVTATTPTTTSTPTAPTKASKSTIRQRLVEDLNDDEYRATHDDDLRHASALDRGKDSSDRHQRRPRPSNRTEPASRGPDLPARHGLK